MKKLFLILIMIVFGCNLITAQTIEEQISIDPDYVAYKEKDKTFFFSEDYQKQLALNREFREKTKNCKAADPYNYSSNFEEWLTKNLTETDFKTVEEGVKLNIERKAITKKNEVVLNELSTIFNKLGDKYDYKILVEFRTSDRDY